jgi:hypothetical protein
MRRRRGGWIPAFAGMTIVLFAIFYDLNNW